VKNNLPITVTLWTTRWCGPGVGMPALLQETVMRHRCSNGGGPRIAAEIKDADTDEAEASEHHVHGLPQFIARRGGQDIDRLVGAQTALSIARWLHELTTP